MAFATIVKVFNKLLPYRKIEKEKKRSSNVIVCYLQIFQDAFLSVPV